MRFGEIPSRDAEGSILAHSVTLPGKTLKKGRVLAAADIAALTDAGVDTVIACTLGSDDVHEDKAATDLAAAATGTGLSRSAAFTGRVNLIADTDGILVYDPTQLNALNSVNEGITLAALPPYSRVAPRQMAATAKIIPFGVPAEALASALPTEPLFTVHPFRPVTLVLIQTVLDGTKSSVLDKTDRVMEQRAAALGATLAPPDRCAHSEAALADALSRAAETAPAAITVVGASAIVDRRDVIPAAIERCGGTIDHFGMPVDPGNLLLLGRIGSIPVIGAPGCVRSPKPNGYDWVMERLVAGLPVTPQSIMAMGVGGFLKEIPSRPRPRAQEDDDGQPERPRIAGLLLAAGLSRRMAPRNKLLEDLGGIPVVRRSAEILLASDLEGVVAVTGNAADRVKAALDGLDIDCIDNPLFDQGMAESVKRGLTRLPGWATGALFALGDMPTLKVDTVNRLIAGFDPTEGRSICVPVYNGQRGNPVLFARRYFAEIMDLSGDRGAKSLIAAYPDEVAEIQVDDPGVLVDLDTPEALAAIRDKFGS
ncbi:NTP transferase domain-containing protein [Rhodospirillaceae bacterium KN72]|uniref:NTP transferase domain-containing protein n=1 Tax=Pacificispira spongiicola TaxID=2729598 RepID=A0A7Y0E063_9PROT|nr:molybdopterin-binding/glycosyltransferase family 2 protein [Pacificispira spongiicola]NMM44056.1 NTP transferase domain-containing protein [Pacificispira spongiicola]